MLDHLQAEADRFRVYNSRVSLHGERYTVTRRLQAIWAYRVANPQPWRDHCEVVRRYGRVAARVGRRRSTLLASLDAMSLAGFDNVARQLRTTIDQTSERARRSARKLAIRREAEEYEIDRSRRLRTDGRGWDQHLHRPGEN